MKIRIEINCNTSAFNADTGEEYEELSRILSATAERMQETERVIQNMVTDTIRDINGNIVGYIKFD